MERNLAVCQVPFCASMEEENPVGKPRGRRAETKSQQSRQESCCRCEVKGDGIIKNERIQTAFYMERTTMIMGAGAPLDLTLPKGITWPSTTNITNEVRKPYNMILTQGQITDL